MPLNPAVADRSLNSRLSHIYKVSSRITKTVYTNPIKKFVFGVGEVAQRLSALTGQAHTLRYSQCLSTVTPVPGESDSLTDKPAGKTPMRSKPK